MSIVVVLPLHRQIQSWRNFFFKLLFVMNLNGRLLAVLKVLNIKWKEKFTLPLDKTTGMRAIIMWF